MEIEIEMTTELTDMSAILQKVTQVVNFAKEQGFNIKELEIESEDDHMMMMMMMMMTNSLIIIEYNEMQKFWSKDIQLLY